MTMHFRIMIYVAVTLLIQTLGCSCGYKYVELPPASISVRIVDDDGREITDVILVTVYRQTKEHIRPPIADAPYEPYRVLKAKLATVDSGFTLRQGEISRMEYPTGEGIRTRFTAMEYIFMKEGYTYAGPGINDTTVAGYAKTGTQAVVRFNKLKADDPDSDTAAISEAEYFLEDVIPHIEKRAPLRGRLLGLLISNLSQVRDPGLLRERAETALETLKSLQ